MRNTALLVATGLVLCACGNTDSDPETPRDGATIAKDAIIADGHIDVPIRLEFRPADITQSTEDGDFDYPRAVEGALNAPFMSIYTPASYMEEAGKSYAFANKLIDRVEGFVEAAPDKFAIATSVADVRRHFEQGLISLPMGMENGSPIEGELSNLDLFFERGIRYITLCHSLSNRIADSSYDKENRPWSGLSPFGRDVVKRMNALGIMVDVSHISDEAFYDVMEVSSAPVIASHSSARHFTPGFERNMDDDMIRALAENGGIIMINFGSSFLTEDALKYARARSDALDAIKESTGTAVSPDMRQAFYTKYAEEHGPFPFATLDDVLDHIDHVVKLVGVEHVGLGSDYDGVGDSLPVGLKDVSDFPNLVDGLLDRGYDEASIRLILGENLLRVWAAVEAEAAA